MVGINLDTMRPMPTVEGYTVPGGFSGQAVRPLALRQVMECARACPDVSISGMGGVENALDAAGAGSTIVIQTRKDGEKVCLSKPVSTPSSPLLLQNNRNIYY